MRPVSCGYTNNKLCPNGKGLGMALETRTIASAARLLQRMVIYFPLIK
jgi:hypothetical protein